jgi:hypothetical protein
LVQKLIALKFKQKDLIFRKICTPKFLGCYSAPLRGGVKRKNPTWAPLILIPSPTSLTRGRTPRRALLTSGGQGSRAECVAAPCSRSAGQPRRTRRRSPRLSPSAVAAAPCGGTRREGAPSLPVAWGRASMSQGAAAPASSRASSLHRLYRARTEAVAAE